MRLGIDFGTTRTVVAAAMDGRYAVASFDVGGDFRDYLPGMAVRRSDGDAPCYGWDAAAALVAEPVAAVRSIKRVISTCAAADAIVGLGAPAVTALELATGFLRHVREMLQRHSNLDLPEGPLSATVAVPANASSRQRFLTIEAFRRAGFVVDAVINEPTAAAIEFAHRYLRGLGERSPKSYMVVYDLGGGTFDTSAISLLDRRFELLVTEGIGRLGGDDFDEVILEAALESAGVDAADLRPTARESLLDACREAKEALRPNSRQVLVELEPHLPGAGSAVVDVEQIYDRCEPLIQRSLDLVGSVFAQLERYGIDPENPRELGGLYLVGGGVAFPPVGRLLRALYKRKIKLAPQPHAATAVGLAVAADPDAGVLVREAVTRHFGVWREADGGQRPIFDAILSKDTLPEGDAPLVVRRVYRPGHSVGHLRFLECGRLDAQGQPAEDLTPWQEVLFPYDPALAGVEDLRDAPIQRRDDLRDEVIAETYHYGTDGSVSVHIENRTRGYARRWELGARG